MKGKGARVVYGARFVEQHKVYMAFEVPERGHKRFFYTMVLKGNPFFTIEEDRLRIPLQRLFTF